MKAEPIRAWQPLTFGGVARYAHDWIGRIIFTGLVIALCVAAAVVWTALRAWVPVVVQSIKRLPPGCEIRAGRLRAPAPVRLAENAFLCLALDPRDDGAASSSDLQVTLGASEIRFRSLFGTSSIPYQLHWSVNLSRADMEPWWGAWRPAVLAGLALGTIAFLFLNWMAISVPYSLVPLGVALLMGRKLGVWGAWKLSVAALMPGAVFMTIAIALYGAAVLRVPEMIGAFVLHFLIGWVFLLAAPFRLPRKEENPFRDGSEGTQADGKQDAQNGDRTESSSKVE